MKKIALHLALILAQTATVCASERPWWESEVAREMALIPYATRVTTQRNNMRGVIKRVLTI